MKEEDSELSDDLAENTQVQLVMFGTVGGSHEQYSLGQVCGQAV